MTVSAANSVITDAGPLASIKVVEYGHGVSAAFASKYLADLGAEVIKVEPPGGDATRLHGPFFDDIADPEGGGLFLYLNANKKSVVLELERSADRDTFDLLLGWADILIHNVAPVDRDRRGVSGRALRARFPHLIVAGISPYGDSGPCADYRGYDLNVMHASGFAAINPGCSQFPELPPAKLMGQQSDFHVGAHAAMVALAAYFQRIHTGAGRVIDIPAQECFLALLGSSLPFYTYAGKMTTRLGVRYIAPWMAVECADGKLYVACIEENQWRGLLKLLGDPEWGGDEIFKDRVTRAHHVDALRALLEDLTRRWKVGELYHEAQKLRLPVAPLNLMADVYGNEQLRARDFFVPIPNDDARGRTIMGPGAPCKFSTMRWALRRRAPRLGEHNEEIRRRLKRSGVARESAAADPVSVDAADPQPRPLSAIHVLDLSWVWAGPYCTAQLAQLGADVIRIESARRPCLFRALPPYADNVPGLNRSGCFNQWNRGKRSVALDLSQPKAIEIVRKMTAWADVVVENFAPGVTERMGLGYQALRAIKPNLIMLSLSGYGQTGPYRGYVSYGGLTGAQSGFYALNGYPDDEPRDLGATYADPTAGVIGAVALMQALVHRELSGEGQYIDLSMLEALETFAAEGLLEFTMNGREPRRMANRDARMAPHNCYKARGDVEMWVSIAVGSEREWRALCAAIGRPALAEDPRFASAAMRKRNEDELDRTITSWTRERDRWEITELLQRAGVAAFPTMSNKDLAGDQHLIERGFIVEVDHPEAGRRKHTSIPWTMSGTSDRMLRRAPLLGEDTAEVLRSVFGYSADEIERLAAEGILY